MAAFAKRLWTSLAALAVGGGLVAATAAIALPGAENEGHYGNLAAPVAEPAGKETAASSIRRGAAPATAQNSIPKVLPKAQAIADDETDEDLVGRFTRMYRTTDLVQGASQNLGVLGQITDLTIGGFNTDDSTKLLKITELRFYGTDASTPLTDWTVRRVNYESPLVGESVLQKMADGSSPADFGLKDGVLTAAPTASSAVIIQNASAAAAVSLEVSFTQPTTVTRIDVAFNGGPKANGTSLGFLAARTTGDVFRTSELVVPGASHGSGSSFNVSIGALSATWTRYSTTGDATGAYLFAADLTQQAFWVDKTVLYVSDDDRYAYAVPFPAGGRLDARLTSRGDATDTRDLTFQTSVSDSAANGFLQLVTDVDFWRETLFRLTQINPGATRSDATVDSFRRLSDATSGQLRFEIILGGSAGAVVENSLSNMVALRGLTKLNVLEVGTSGAVGQAAFPYRLNLFKQRWIGTYSAIATISAPRYGSSNADLSSTQFYLVGDFNDAVWLSNLPLVANVNLTSYVNYDGQNPLNRQMAAAQWFGDYLGSLITSSQSITILISHDRTGTNNPVSEEKIPNGLINRRLNAEIVPQYEYYAIVQANQVVYTRIPDPAIYYDLIKGWVGSQLLVDESIVDLFVLESDIFWNFDNAYTIINGTRQATPVDKNLIFAYYPAGKIFVTEAYKNQLMANNGDLTDEDFTILPRDGVLNYPTAIQAPTPNFEVAVDGTNYQASSKSFFINEEQVEQVLYNSRRIILSDNLDRFEYYYEDASSVHIFTDLRSLLLYVPQVDWQGKEINQVAPSSQPRDAYLEYKALPPGKLAVPDPQRADYPGIGAINVNGATYDVNNVEIYDSQLYWRFNDGVSIDDVKYVDGLGQFYTDLSPDLDWSSGISAIAVHDPYPDNIFNTRQTPQQPTLTDANLTTFESLELNVNNTIVHPRLYNGNVLWDADLNDIRYYTQNGVWYTEQAFTDALFDQGLYTVTKRRRETPPVVTIATPANGLVLRRVSTTAEDPPAPSPTECNPGDVTGSGCAFKAVLIGGVWKWYLTFDAFNAINYVDLNGTYYTSLDSVARVNALAVSSVDRTSDWSTNKYQQTADSRQRVSQSFNLFSDLEGVKAGYTVNGTHFEYVIRNSLAYIPDSNFQRISFIGSASAGRVYVSSFALINRSELSSFYSAIVDADPSLPPGYAGEDVVAPEDGTVTIQIRGADNIIYTSQVMASIDPETNTLSYFFDNVDAATRIRFKTDSGLFLESLDVANPTDGLISQVKPFAIRTLLASDERSGVVETSITQLRTAVAAATIGSIGLLGAMAGGIKLVARLRARRK